MLVGTLACSSLTLVGCGPSGEDSQVAEQKGGAPDTKKAAPTAAPGAMIVYRDPSCGCCESWARIAAKAGFKVDLRDDADMAGVKRRLGVPEDLSSCHTAEVAGLVVEGHVPLEDVARLLRERPPGIRGIAVPGMPAGSPGMEMPDGTKQPFQVIAFDASGRTSVFRAQSFNGQGEE
jgi:hypothetical protein